MFQQINSPSSQLCQGQEANELLFAAEEGHQGLQRLRRVFHTATPAAPEGSSDRSYGSRMAQTAIGLPVSPNAFISASCRGLRCALQVASTMQEQFPAAFTAARISSSSGSSAVIKALPPSLPAMYSANTGSPPVRLEACVDREAGPPVKSGAPPRAGIGPRTSVNERSRSSRASAVSAGPWTRPPAAARPCLAESARSTAALNSPASSSPPSSSESSRSAASRRRSPCARCRRCPRRP